MDNNTEQKAPESFRKFGPVYIALKNKNTVYILTGLLVLFGFFSYKTMLRESFPEIVIPTILVQTPYPGNSPVDIEALITRPIEKELKSLKDVDNMTSASYQDMSVISIEFETDIEINEALQRVKDQVDKAMSELPDDLSDVGSDPIVEDLDFSEFPILNVNLFGDFSIVELKGFAEDLKEEFEGLSEISEANINGVDEREIQINVDLHKMESHGLTFGDISDAVNFENVTMGAGEVITDGTRRSLRVEADFTNVKQIGNIIVKTQDGKSVYLKDIADVVDGFEEKSTISRLDNKPVVSLGLVKKSGENLLVATDKIFEILDEAKKSGMVPKSLNIVVTDDQSTFVRDQISNLENSIIMGMLLVIFVLYLFLGLRNALFSGLAIPASMLISIILLDAMGQTINTMVLFGLVLALGMLVDNAIVVVENVYRYHERGLTKLAATKRGASEIAIPIIASTATTLAAFTPLLLWEGIVGEFMKYLPITLIVVLSSSLFVALVLNPVFTARYVKVKDIREKMKTRKLFIVSAIFAAAAILVYLTGIYWVANLLALVPILTLINIYFSHPLAKWFQLKFLPWLENIYESSLKFALKKYNPIIFFIGTFVFMIFTWMFYGAQDNKVVFFPEIEPNSIYIVMELPVGNDIEVTNRKSAELEEIVNETIEPYDHIIKSLAINVGVGMMNAFEAESSPNKSTITISFEDYQYRHGISTADVKKEITENVKDFTGAEISVMQDEAGPPVGNPINIEVTGDDFNTLLSVVEDLRNTLRREEIPGIEQLKLDIDTDKPEMRIHIDREKVRKYGLTTQDVAWQLRNSLYGLKVDKFKDGEDEYDIMLRYSDEYRHDVNALMNQKVTVNETGAKIPVSAIATYEYNTTYDKINRKDYQRVVTIYSNVLEGYNANQINEQIRSTLKSYEMPPGYDWAMTGEQQEQAETAIFLMRALFIAISLIALILVTQFNSGTRPLIIIITVLFSTIGVFLGLGLTGQDFVILMTGIGIISLAGVVVNNGIVLIDYIELLRNEKRDELGLDEDGRLSREQLVDCIVRAGKTRLRPVLLTAITTVLGLLPLALGMNFDFFKLFSEFDPNIYFGGTNAAFWGPMAWTVIYGLTLATFLTLVIAPVMYLLFTKKSPTTR